MTWILFALLLAVILLCALAVLLELVALHDDDREGHK